MLRVLGGCMLQSEGMRLLPDETREQSSEEACIVSICVGITSGLPNPIRASLVLPRPSPRSELAPAKPRRSSHANPDTVSSWAVVAVEGLGRIILLSVHQ